MRQGFSLIELSAALALAGIIAGFALIISDKSSSAECYTATKTQINNLKEAVERFAIKNDRFPMPARRNIGIENKKYGHEVNPAISAEVAELDSVTNTDSTIAVFGALPFQTLGISAEKASDCWGNKYTYVMTKALTDKTQFLSPTTNGALDIKTNATTFFLKGAGYAIISHGADALGAVKSNYSGTDKKWCKPAASGELRTENCDITNTTLVAADFNDGKESSANFFDDVIIYRGKPWRIGVGGNGAVYCWGGKGAKPYPTNANAMADPVDSTAVFTKIRIRSETGGTYVYALADDKHVYRWVLNGKPELTTESESLFDYGAPLTLGGVQLVTMSESYMQAFTPNQCGLTSGGDAYCWGKNANRQLGNANVSRIANVTVPTRVDMSNVEGKFDVISTGPTHSCALTTAGVAYCWGAASEGGIGNSIVSGWPFKTPQRVSGALKFAGISVGNATTCAVTIDGTPYCWGYGAYGALGSGAIPFAGNVSSRNMPGPVVATTSLTPTFSAITTSGGFSCGIYKNE